MALALTQSGSGIGQAITQAFTASLLALGVVGWVMGALKRRVARVHQGLFYAVTTWLFAVMMSTVFGASPSLSLAHLVPPVLFIAMLLSPLPSTEWMAKTFYRILTVYVLGSAAAYLINPSWAAQLAYSGSLIPGFNVRLYGLTVHANILGLMLWAYLTLVVSGTMRFSRWQPLMTLLALGMLVMTQSKTALALTAATLLLLGLFSFLRGRDSRLSTAIKLLAVVGILVATYTVTSVDLSDSTLTDRQSDLTTLTGRTGVWEVALETWRASPLTGYGPHLFDVEMALENEGRLGWIAQHAHNQYIQTLGEFGVLGVIGFGSYVLALLALAWRARGHWRGLLVILVGMLLLRGLSETWYRRTVVDGNLTIHMFVFLMVVSTSRRDRQRLADG